MSSVGSVSLEGLDELKTKLALLGADVKKETANAGLASMQRFVERPAKDKCPVDNGPLRASIQTTVMEEQGQTLVKTGTSMEYGPYVEFGTGKYAEGGGGRSTPWLWVVNSRKWSAIFGIPQGTPILWHGSHPHPFLRPAFDENKDNVLNDMSDRLKAAVLRYSK